MANMIFTALIVGGFVLWDVIPMYQERKWKPLSVYVCLMLFILTLVFLKQVIHVHIPSPASPMKEALIAIFGEK